MAPVFLGTEISAFVSCRTSGGNTGFESNLAVGMANRRAQTSVRTLRPLRTHSRAHGASRILSNAPTTKIDDPAAKRLNRNKVLVVMFAHRCPKVDRPIHDREIWLFAVSSERKLNGGYVDLPNEG